MIVTSWYVDASFGVNSVPWSEGNFLNETPPAALITVGPENAQFHHLQNEADSCYEVCGLDLDLQFGLILFLRIKKKKSHYGLWLILRAWRPTSRSGSQLPSSHNSVTLGNLPF